MSFQVSQLVGLLQGEGVACELVPAGAEATVEGFASLAGARPGTLAFSLRPALPHPVPCAVLLAPPATPADAAPVVVRTEDPRLAFVLALHRFGLPERPSGVDPTARIAGSCMLGRDVAVGPYAVLGEDVRVGDGSAVGAHAVLLAGTVVGRGCSIGAGSVLGSPGFGFVRHRERWLEFPHVGAVVLEDDVWVGALATIDRGALDDTVIRRGTRIDSHCHVAHNASVGPDAVLTAGATIGGTARVGTGVLLGLGSVVSDRVSVGDEARVPLGGVIAEPVPAGSQLVSLPSLDLRGLARLLRLARTGRVSREGRPRG
jgi:UDP-3-O-[3-hydroxymyristoyl] glucosamine N-acyltransferase